MVVSMEEQGRDIAIDNHTRSRLVVMATREGKELFRRRFGVDAQGTAALLAVVRAGDRVILEATTGSMQLANRLEAAGAQVFLVDPQRTRLVGFRGKKTDYRDCLALLEHLRLGHLALVWRPDAAIRAVRQLTRERFAFNQSIVRLKNRIRGLLVEEGYEAPNWLFSAAGERWWSALPLAPTSRAIVRREWAALAALEQCKEEEKEMFAAWALELPLAQRLMQLTGFGIDLAVMWVGEVGDLTRFPSAKQLVSYGGLDPRVQQSGDHCYGGRISKAGRSQLRWIMVEVAHHHVAANGPEAGYYHRLVAAGKRPAVAMVALARRLLVLCYLLLTRETTHREVDLKRYEEKLTALGAHRPYPEPSQDQEISTPQASNRDWAAARVEALTGCVSPRRAAGTRFRTRRGPRRSRRAPEERASNRTVSEATGARATSSRGPKEDTSLLPPEVVGAGTKRLE